MRYLIWITIVAGPFIASACAKNDVRVLPEAKADSSESVLRQAVMVDGTGFHPSEIHARAGQKVTLVLHRTTDETCAKRIVFKDLGVSKDLPLNEKVEVSLTATTSPIAFTCGMDMMRGSVVAH